MAGRCQGQETCDAALKTDLSLVKDHDLVVQIIQILGLVGGDQNVHILGEFGQQLAEDPALRGVEPGGGFVQEHDVAVMDERTGQPHTAQLAAGELMALASPQLVQVHSLQRPACASLRLGTGDALEPAEVGDILSDCQPRHWLHALGQLPGPCRSDVRPSGEGWKLMGSLPGGGEGCCPGPGPIQVEGAAAGVGGESGGKVVQLHSYRFRFSGGEFGFVVQETHSARDSAKATLISTWLHAFDYLRAEDNTFGRARPRATPATGLPPGPVPAGSADRRHGRIEPADHPPPRR